MLIGYARVSTQDQDPDLQIRALTEVGCDKIFSEKASGVQRDRPELAALLAYVRQGDTLVVWKLDRLARSLKQLLETVEALEERGIGFRSVTEAIDTTTPGGRLVFTIFGALAEFERSIIRERTLAGLQAARARGKVGGRPLALMPADIAAARSLLANPEISVREVAKRIGCSPATLYRYLPAAKAGAVLLARTHRRRCLGDPGPALRGLRASTSRRQAGGAACLVPPASGQAPLSE